MFEYLQFFSRWWKSLQSYWITYTPRFAEYFYFPPFFGFRSIWMGKNIIVHNCLIWFCVHSIKFGRTRFQFHFKRCGTLDKFISVYACAESVFYLGHSVEFESAQLRHEAWAHTKAVSASAPPSHFTLIHLSLIHWVAPEMRFSTNNTWILLRIDQKESKRKKIIEPKLCLKEDSVRIRDACKKDSTRSCYFNHIENETNLIAFWAQFSV